MAPEPQQPLGRSWERDRMALDPQQLLGDLSLQGSWLTSSTAHSDCMNTSPGVPRRLRPSALCYSLGS